MKRLSSTPKTTALIDGDVIVYRVAWACQATHYSVYLKGDEELGRLASFPNKTELNAWLKDMEYDEDDLTIETKVVVDSVSHALHSVKAMIHSILETTKTEFPNIYLSGPNNFRNDIYPAYKAGRAAKPELYSAIRGYLVEYWGAIVCDGIEADDALGINQTPDTIICTNDKDLDMIPGSHYNFVKDIMYEVSEEEANLNFDKQLLTGDRTDNIYGIYNIGDKTAHKMLADTHPADRDAIIFLEYQKYWGDAWKEVYDLNCDLLWILREPMYEAKDNRG